jgi:hypothetical protein
MGTTHPRVRLPSPALILSCIALFAALGASTYAATSIGTSSVHFQNAALKNGWKRSGTTAPAGYVKDSSGIVHLRGGIANGSSNTVAFVLPKALRPSHPLFPVIVAEGPTVAYLRIQRNGDVSPSGSGGVSGFTGLDGVSFAAGE